MFEKWRKETVPVKREIYPSKLQFIFRRVTLAKHWKWKQSLKALFFLGERKQDHVDVKIGGKIAGY